MKSEIEQFEAELQRLRPAKAPEEFMAKLEKAALAQPALRPPRAKPGLALMAGSWRLWRLIGPAAALIAAAALLVSRDYRHAPARGPAMAPNNLARTIKADRIDFDRQLVTAFDAIARLPGGEPVRFRCRQWLDELVVHDAGSGVVIEQQTPRLEVVPVKFETY